MPTMNRYLRAVRCNLDNLQRAKMARICAQGFENDWPPTHLHAKLYYNALLNDNLTKCIKVFEWRRQAASFWYIERTNSAAMLSALDGKLTWLEELLAVSERLKHIRDKVHFHIDEHGVLNPDGAWQDAALSRDRLDRAVDTANGALMRLADQHQIQIEMISPDMTIFLSTRVAVHLNGLARCE